MDGGRTAPIIHSDGKYSKNKSPTSDSLIIFKFFFNTLHNHPNGQTAVFSRLVLTNLFDTSCLDISFKVF